MSTKPKLKREIKKKDWGAKQGVKQKSGGTAHPDIPLESPLTSCNHLGAFYLTCFARVCEIFTSVVSESQHGPNVVL